MKCCKIKAKEKSGCAKGVFDSFELSKCGTNRELMDDWLQFLKTE